MLKRSQGIRSKEDLVLPLYEPLAKNAAEGDFRAPFFNVLCGLAVISNDTLWEKLTFITHLFDVNDNKVGGKLHLFLRLRCFSVPLHIRPNVFQRGVCRFG